MAELLSIRGYARHRDVNHNAVRKAIASGRITMTLDEKGKKKIDPTVADAQWARNTDPVEAARSGTPIVLAPDEKFEACHGSTSEGSDEAAAPLTGGLTAPPGVADDQKAYLSNRALTEKFKAKDAELSYLERVGSLVSVATVREGMFEMARRVRDNMMLIGARLAPRLAAETDPVAAQRLIDNEIRKVLSEQSRELAATAA